MPALGKEICQLSLEYLAAAESEAVLKTKPKKSDDDGGASCRICQPPAANPSAIGATT